MIYNAYSSTEEGLFGISIKSAGHVFAKKGRKILRPQGREDWLLFYVAKGCERFTLDRECDAKEGSFLFYKPGQPQEHTYIDEKTGEFYYIHFNAPADFDLLGFESFKIYSAPPSAGVVDLFLQVISELQVKNIHYEKICIALFLNIILNLKRKIGKAGGTTQKNIHEISFVIENMNREYYKNYSLQEYADMCCMSRFHFLRVFKTITGTTPLEYRNKLRLEHAVALLKDTGESIAEIAGAVGFATQGYFCDAFKKKYGMSPTEYRKNF